MKNEKPDIIGVTVFPYHVNDILNFMKSMKGIDSKILTVIGGPHLADIFCDRMSRRNKRNHQKTIEFAVELDPDQVAVTAYATPYPGTEFYEIVKKEADIEAISQEDFHHSRKVLYVPKNLTKEDIEEGKRMFCEILKPHTRQKIDR